MKKIREKIPCIMYIFDSRKACVIKNKLVVSFAFKDFLNISVYMHVMNRCKKRNKEKAVTRSKLQYFQFLLFMLLI